VFLHSLHAKPFRPNRHLRYL